MFLTLLFAQPGGGGGFIEILQVIVVLLFIFGPAVLKLLFGQNNKKAADVPAAPRQMPVDAEIDEFLTRQSSERLAEKVMVRSAQDKGVAGDKRSRRVRKRDAAPIASPERVALSSFTATPITASSKDTLALSVSAASDVTHRKHFIHPVTTLLHTPSTLMNAVVLSEVLKRPDAAQW